MCQTFDPITPLVVYDVVNLPDERSFRDWLVLDWQGNPRQLWSEYVEYQLRRRRTRLPKAARLYRAEQRPPAGFSTRRSLRPLQRGNWSGQNEPFYCALDERTAIAEVLRKDGSTITDEEVRAVEGSRFLPKRDLDVIDLKHAGDPAARYEFYRRWDEPSLMELQYRHTAGICELVRQAGVNGILYESSWNRGGMNVVLFDRDCTEPLINDPRAGTICRRSGS